MIILELTKICCIEYIIILKVFDIYNIKLIINRNNKLMISLTFLINMLIEVYADFSFSLMTANIEYT